MIVLVVGGWNRKSYVVTVTTIVIVFYVYNGIKLIFYFQVHTVPLGFNREEAVGREAAATAAAAVAAAASALSPEDKAAAAAAGEEEILAAAEAEVQGMGVAEQRPKWQGDDDELEEETRMLAKGWSGRHLPGDVRAASLRLRAASNGSSGGERDRGPDFEGASDGAETRSGATGCYVGDGSEGGRRMEVESGSSGRGVYRLVFTMVRFCSVRGDFTMVDE